MIVLPAGEGTDLVLRDPATDAEAAALLVRHRERVARVAPWAERVPDGPPDPDATATWTGRFLRDYADGTGITCAVRHDGRLVGAVDATIDPMASTAELGWWLAPEAEGRGIARRAVEALGDHLVHRRGLRRLSAGIAPDNERSLVLVRRLGLVHEATKGSALAFADRREDVLVHGVLADEWTARRPGPGDELAIPVDDDLELVLPESRFHDELATLTEANLDRLRRFEAWAQTFDAARNAIWWQTCMRAWADGDALPMIVRDRAAGDLLGPVGATIDRANGSAELGYWIDAGAEGRGVVSRCARALVDVLTGERGLLRVQLRTATHNERSRAVAERLGMRHEGTLRAASLVAGEPHDHDLFAIVR